MAVHNRCFFRLLTFVVWFLLVSTTAAFAQVTPIHDVQGPGSSSPIVGNVVTTRGIVTGVTANGFFIQEEDANVDADPATSEGIFVFTSSAPPAAAVFAARVEVTGTVTEFVPSADPLQPPSTQLTSPTVVQLATGQPLPAAIPLTTTFPDPAGPHDQLERVEHMRVSVASLTVTGPSGGTVNETDATGTSNGRFHGVITGVARPFREPGIQAPDPAPSGSIPPIPRWDANPERIGVASAAITGQPLLTVRSSDTVASLVGPLDYASRTYTISPDGTSTATITPGSLPTTVSAPAGNEITVASVNLRRFFDTIDAPSVADVVLTPAAYERRLAKTSVAIRDHLRNPDIIGVQEVETADVLSDLAARILADGGPAYQPFLVPGNDAAGLNVGFLYKTAAVSGGVARVSNTSGTQVGAAETWIDPATGALALLNDRPSLVLEATVNRTSTSGMPIVVIVSDLIGLEGIDSFVPAGSTTVGDRVRRKRLAQAESLANYVQGRLTANPGEHLLVTGSHNAFEVNDGHVDVMNVIAGTPPPDNETSVPGDGVDLVNPDLLNLVNTPPPVQRYSSRVRRYRPQPRSRAGQHRARRRYQRTAHRASAHRSRLPRDRARQQRDGAAVLRSRSGGDVSRRECAEPRRPERHERRNSESGDRRPESHLRHHRHEQWSGRGRFGDDVGHAARGHDVRLADRPRRLVLFDAGCGRRRRGLMLDRFVGRRQRSVHPRGDGLIERPYRDRCDEHCDRRLSHQRSGSGQQLGDGDSDDNGLGGGRRLDHEGRAGDGRCGWFGRLHIDSRQCRPRQRAGCDD